MVMTAVSTPVVFLDRIRAGLLGGVSSVAESETDHGLSEEELWGEDGEWRLTEEGPLESQTVDISGRLGEAGPGGARKAGFFGWLVAVLSLWSAAVIVAVFSRARETAADRTAVEVTGSPAALAGALRSLDERITETPARDRREVSSLSLLSILPLDRGMFGDADRELPEPPGFVVRPKQLLFGTHPPVAKRLERLSRLESQQESEQLAGPLRCGERIAVSKRWPVRSP